MSKGKARFSAADVTRAVAAVVHAGLPVSFVEALPDGTIRVHVGDAISSKESDERRLDQEIEEWRQRRDAQQAEDEASARKMLKEAALRLTHEDVYAFFAERPRIVARTAAKLLGTDWKIIDHAVTAGLMKQARGGGESRFTPEMIIEALWPSSTRARRR